jgi:hypothetical protein
MLTPQMIRIVSLGHCVEPLAQVDEKQEGVYYHSNLGYLIL